jgi:hypothetical protein
MLASIPAGNTSREATIAAGNISLEAMRTIEREGMAGVFGQTRGSFDEILL